jgi:hypothetical protein
VRELDNGLKFGDGVFAFSLLNVNKAEKDVRVERVRVNFHSFLQLRYALVITPGAVESQSGERVMFGSDQMVWAGVIEPAIKSIEQAPFLNYQQKRDIFYNNASRFLRFTPEEIAQHHRMGLTQNNRVGAKTQTSIKKAKKVKK